MMIIATKEFRLLTSYIVSMFNISSSSVKYMYSQSDKAAYDDFVAGRSKYALLYEPYLSYAIDNGAEIVFTGTDYRGLIMDVIVFSSSYIKSNGESVSGYIRAYFKAVKYLQANKKSHTK